MVDNYVTKTSWMCSEINMSTGVFRKHPILTLWFPVGGQSILNFVGVILISVFKLYYGLWRDFLKAFFN